ncbi:ankyrin repeat-containing domain protein [Aspergillus pseudoustus]|uniref:Ankyrin repeat-containing domain protein n=1 Tax=Aspergillus pseudoustus TaxID=1810923 RepID=A0ABR4IHS1_9EURO
MAADSSAPAVGGAFARIAATKVLATRKRNKINQSRFKEDRTHLAFEDAGGPTRILGDIETQVQQAKQNQWRFRKRNGEEVTVREVFEKIATWVAKFKEIGDIAAGIDPAHVGLPWAAVRFFLQLAVSDVERYSAMIEGVELVSGIIARYAEVEKAELIGRSNPKTQLENALVKLYGTVLSYLAETRSEQWLERIAAEDDAAHRLVTLVQAENQANRLFSIRRTLANLEESISQAKTGLVSTRRRLLERLGATYTNDNYDGSLSLRQSGTASWIFERDVFKKWMATSTKSQFLWMYGPPGFGKTVLAASVVEHLRQERPNTTAYFFCVSENEAKREPFAILTSWIAQLVEQNESAVKVASGVINIDDQRAISRTEQWKVFSALCSHIKGGTFVIDGIDECTSVNNTSRFHTDGARSQFLRELLDAICTSKADVLMVSRDTAEIRTEIFRHKVAAAEVLHYAITESDTRPDIQSVSRHVVDFKLHKKPDEVRSQLAEKAADKAEGMFLWVHLLSQKLKPGINAKKLDAVFSQMPTGLEQAYERDLHHIYSLDQDERDRAISILRWVLFAARPLTVRELVEALILSGDMDQDEAYPEDELPDNWGVDFVDEDYVNEILRLSAYTVHFVHYSVKEYLLRPNASGISPAQDICFRDTRSENDLLARLCLQYLCYDVFGNEEVLTEREMKTYPFFRYAARTSYHHALAEDGISPDLMPCARKLLNPETFKWVLWSRAFEVEEGDGRDAEESSGGAQTSKAAKEAGNRKEQAEVKQEEVQDSTAIKTATNPIYYACLLGLLDVVRRLHADGVDLNVVGGVYGTPLQAAIVKGHTQTVRYLLENGADLSVEAGVFSHPICAAAWAGDVEVFRLLIDRGAELSLIAQEYGMRPVHLATYHPGILQICLERGVDLTVGDSRGLTPLHWAAQYGNIESARILAQAGVDINSEAKDRGTAALLAVQHNHGDMLSFLLSRAQTQTSPIRKGEDRFTAQRNIECETTTGFTPLIAANMYPGHPRIVQRLLEHGAEVDHGEADGWTALHFSSKLGNTEIMSLLLEHGADVEGENTAFVTPILQAAASGSPDALDLLLKHGADIANYDIDGDTALDYAMHGGKHELVLYLLEKDLLTASVPGTTADTRLKEQRIKLTRAIFAADVAQVEAMLEEMQADSLDTVWQTALHAASLGGSTPVTKLLLSKGASTKPMMPNRRTALHYAAFNACLGIVKVLLEAGAGPYDQDLYRSYPLDLAIQRGLESAETVKYLIQRHGFGPDIAPATRAVIDAWRSMAGTARGTCTYTSWCKGIEEETSFDIAPWKEEQQQDAQPRDGDGSDQNDEKTLGKPPTFTGAGTDKISSFEIYGTLYGEWQVVWAKLYSGTLDTETRTITGHWGRNTQLWHGTFTIRVGSQTK